MEQVVQRTRVGAYVVCVQDDALLLVRFSGSERWSVPGGGLDHGERPEDAAVREVDEETGLEIVLGAVLGVDSTRWDRERRQPDRHARPADPLHGRGGR